MQTLGVFKGSVRSRWIEQGFGKTPLILSGQAEDGMRLNGALGGIMGGADGPSTPCPLRAPCKTWMTSICSGCRR